MAKDCHVQSTLLMFVLEVKQSGGVRELEGIPLRHASKCRTTRVSCCGVIPHTSATLVENFVAGLRLFNVEPEDLQNFGHVRCRLLRSEIEECGAGQRLVSRNVSSCAVWHPIRNPW